MAQCKIKQEGDHVHVRFDPQESLIPWRDALALADAIRAAAKLAEAFANQNQAIADTVLLERAGLPGNLFMRGLLDKPPKGAN